MANVLPFHVRVRIVECLVNGNSQEATARIVHANKDAVAKLALTVGLGCIKLHQRLVKGVPAKYLEVDEVWTFVGRHERRKRKSDPRWYGDQYTMFALDPESKLVPAYLTGKRSPPGAVTFMKDLRARVRGKPQISVDGWTPWVEAVARAFGYQNVHLASVVKEYQKVTGVPQAGAGSYGRVKSVKKTVIFGLPDHDHISTAMAERLNMTTRMAQRRLTRLSNAYSKKKLNLVAAVGLHFMHYNFVRVHEALSEAPAVIAGLVKQRWTMAALVQTALEEMGEMNTPRSKLTRYKRKTHVLVSTS